MECCPPPPPPLLTVHRSAPPTPPPARPQVLFKHLRHDRGRYEAHMPVSVHVK